MYEPYIDDYKKEYVHIDEIPDLDDMKVRMKNVLDIVYGDSEIEDLEIELEELAAHLDLKLPPRAFKITRIKGK